MLINEAEAINILLCDHNFMSAAVTSGDLEVSKINDIRFYNKDAVVALKKRILLLKTKEHMTDVEIRLPRIL
jgi:hypothetical protein